MTQPSKRRFAAILISGAFASKLLGFGREVLMAQAIGASIVADGFRGAITAIFLPLAFLQNESVPAILIPMQRDAQTRGDAPKRLAELAVALTTVATVLMLVIVALGVRWVDAVVGGFTPAGRQLTLDFVRIMALGMPASVMVNVLAAGEIALGRTRLTNIRASLLNVAVLIGIALLPVTGDVHLLAWSFTIAFNTLGLWAMVTLCREGVLDFRSLTAQSVAAAAIDFARRLRPLLALPMAEQGNVWGERLLASRLATGAVASLDYARTLTESALLIVSQPLGLAVLSEHPAKNQQAQIEAIVRPVLALALPASIYLACFAPEIVRVVFQRGAFNEQGALLTSHALRGIACGLWAGTLGWILIRILNSVGRNAMAALIIVCAYGVNIALNLVTSRLAPSGPDGTLLIGLGEAARGIVLLIAVVAVLECRSIVLALLARAALPALLMGVCCLAVQTAVDGTIARLAAGALAGVASVALSLSLLMPDTCATGMGLVRRWLRKEA